MASQQIGPEKALHFDTEQEALAWLDDTGHYGLTHPSNGHQFIIVTHQSDGVWAYQSPESIVRLDEW